MAMITPIDRPAHHRVIKLIIAGIIIVSLAACGLPVLVSDGATEAVVINPMGEIRPQQFSDVMVALDVDTPGAETVQLVGSEKS
jgi:hypothetical protein